MTKRLPLRLKDVRRLAAKRRVAYSERTGLRVLDCSHHNHTVHSVIELFAQHVGSFYFFQEDEACRQLDRLISKFGPDMVIEQAEAAQGGGLCCSDETEESGSPALGQSGHSGSLQENQNEPLYVSGTLQKNVVNSAASKKVDSTERREGSSTEKKDFSSRKGTSLSSGSEKQKDEIPVAEDKGHLNGVSFQKARCATCSEQDFSSLLGRLEELSSCEKDDGDDAPTEEGVDKQSSSNAADGRQSAPSRQPRSMYGGCYAKLEQIQARLTSAEQKRARQLSQYLWKLFNRVDLAGLDESPRLDSRRLVRALVSKSGRISQAKRRETQKKMVLILTDSSGSCSAHAQDTLAACYQVSRLDPRVVCINHSNGFPIVRDIWTFGDWKLHTDGQFDEEYTDAETVLNWWRGLIESYQVEAVVAFGDGDAAYVYDVIMAKTSNFVWLDSYAKCSGVIVRRVDDSWPYAHRPRAFITGVGDAETACEALKKILR